MLFEQVLPHIRMGRRIRRASWIPGCVYNPVGFPKPFTRASHNTFSFGDLRREDILANDWEVYSADLPPETTNNLA